MMSGETQQQRSPWLVLPNKTVLNIDRVDTIRHDGQVITFGLSGEFKGLHFNDDAAAEDYFRWLVRYVNAAGMDGMPKSDAGLRVLTTGGIES